MEFIPEEKRDKKNILLTKDEFMKIHLWFEDDVYLNELSDLSEENIFIGDFIPNFSINQINLPNNNKKINDRNENESGLSSSIKDNNNEPKIEKIKKIDKIKETIFEINEEYGLLNINIFKELLDKLNNYCQNKKNNLNKNEIKNDSEDVDIDDKCFRFSCDDLNEYLDIDKNIENIQIGSSSKSIKERLWNINNIFDNIFQN